MQQRSSISRSRSVALQAAALQALLVENGNTAISTALHLAASGERAQVLIDIFQFAKHPLPLELQSLPASDFRTRLEAGLLLPAEAGTKRHNAAANLLSPREENILQLAANGMSNKDIARELKVAPETIKTHMKRIFSKMNVSTRGHAISKYFQSA
jgi:DNA-binding NarL/FixJ family response regulator